MTDLVSSGTQVGFDVFPVISENGTERPRLEFSPATRLQRDVCSPQSSAIYLQAN